MTDSLLETASIIHYHRHRIAEYGSDTVEALGWRGEPSQLLRFEVIATVGDLHGCTVLDVGCGRGDLRAYLDRTVSSLTYIGIDLMAEFIRQAEARYRDYPNTFFCQTDFTETVFPQVDYVIASGALCYRSDDPDFHRDMIRKMYGAATRAVAFNMLDAARFPQHPLLVGHDHRQVVAFCEALAPNVELLQGYLEDDFTVFLHRAEAAPT